MINPYLKQYQKNEVETATPEKILILLYDGAIQFLNKAKFAIRQKNVQEIYNNIIGCENIILEFMDTLNRDANPELADNLLMLYKYFYDTLVKANIDHDIDKVQEILNHLVDLRATWQKAINIANAEKLAKQQENFDETLDSSASANDHNWV